MDIFYLGILIFLIVLAVFDLSVGVANDAVNFLSPAIGAKVAKFRTVLLVAAVGIFVGASTSSGMMDIARHGIMNPAYYTLDDVMCLFLAVAATDVILLDIFNTLGMPTSTTVSLVFGLLGGSSALAMSKMLSMGLSYEQLINTDKALQVIIGIFLSVAIAFVFGFIVMWLSRIVFTFNYKRHLRWTVAIFGGISITAIAYFLLVDGLADSKLLQSVGWDSEWIDGHRWALLGWGLLIFTVLMEILHLLRVNVFKVIVLFGTFALAMAFAGNDLVNFIGTPLAGLESFIDFTNNGNGASPHSYMMNVLVGPSQLQGMHWYLMLAGIVMIVAIFTSKKAQKVVETTVNLSRQEEGEEVFSSSRLARRTVRSVLNMSSTIDRFVPAAVKRWINSRFNAEEAILSDGMAFDLVRASVNLVLAGLLIVFGTSLQLPLSTTYVAFMVAMGSSLADRAWGRETAAYRITGVITVIGGWFITAGAAFIVSFALAFLNHIGGYVAMVLLVLLLAAVLINNNRHFKKKREEDNVDTLFRQLVRSHDKQEIWTLLSQHVSRTQTDILTFTQQSYDRIIDGLVNDDIKMLRQVSHGIDNEREVWKRYRKKEILGMRRIDHLLAVEKNTWFHLGCNNCSQIIYCLKRMLEATLEHVDNNFEHMPNVYVVELGRVRQQIDSLLERTREMIATGNFENADAVLVEGNAIKSHLSLLRHGQEEQMQREDNNIRVSLLYLNILQESQEVVSMVRHLLRASKRFQGC